MKTKRAPKCKYCDQEAIWAMQYIAEEKPSFYALGYHIRGFEVTKICDDHFNSIYNEWHEKNKAVQS